MTDLYGYRGRQFYTPYLKRHLEASEEDEYDYGEDESDSNDSDENHKEIDYPDDNSDPNDDDNDDDQTLAIAEEDENMEEDEAMYHHHHSNRRQYENMTQPTHHYPCCICAEIYPVFPHRLDEMDHHPTELPTLSQILVNPCQKHYICVTCIKSSLLNNAVTLFKDGNGNFPCLGDEQCRNHLQQRTTTFIYQLRDLFTDGEWNTVTHALKMYRTSQSVSEHHSYMVPLCPSEQISPEMAYDHIQYLMTQDHPRVQCPICLVPIQKTTACFAIRHCDWEMCWMCGKVERRLDTKHWKTCPRYDSNPFWKLYNYHCSEGECFNDDHSCTVNTHASGRKSMDDIRKAYQVLRFYESFSPPFQSQLNHVMQIRGIWQLFVHNQTQYHAAIFTPR